MSISVFENSVELSESFGNVGSNQFGAIGDHLSYGHVTGVAPSHQGFPVEYSPLSLDVAGSTGSPLHSAGSQLQSADSTGSLLHSVGLSGSLLQSAGLSGSPFQFAGSIGSPLQNAGSLLQSAGSTGPLTRNVGSLLQTAGLSGHLLQSAGSLLQSAGLSGSLLQSAGLSESLTLNTSLSGFGSSSLGLPILTSGLSESPIFIDGYTNPSVFSTGLSNSSTSNVGEVIQKPRSRSIEKYIKGSYKESQNGQPMKELCKREILPAVRIVFQVEIGNGERNMWEPHGVCVSPEGWVFIADTNNKRIKEYGYYAARDKVLCVTDKDYPVGMALHRYGILTIERNPSNSVKLYDRNGTFIKCVINKEQGMNNLRGICVDALGRPIVVTAQPNKMVTVLHSDLSGRFISQFSCSELKFPNAICSSNATTIFVSDNHDHCVHIYNYGGCMMGRVGQMGVTNHPAGILVDPYNRLVVVDNNMGVNITVFTSALDYKAYKIPQQKNAKMILGVSPGIRAGTILILLVEIQEIGVGKNRSGIREEKINIFYKLEEVVLDPKAKA